MVGGYFDYNDTEGFRGTGQLIPAGTYARIKMHIRPGDTMGPEPSDGLIMKASTRSDVHYLDCEFTIMYGPHSKQKFWENWTIGGGKMDDKGSPIGWNITKAKLRSVLDSGLGLDPEDKSDATAAKRHTKGFKDFDGAEFAVRIDVQPGGTNEANGAKYPDKNNIGSILTIKDKELYTKVMAGEEVAPMQSTPTVAASGGTPSNVRGTPAWGAQTAPNEKANAPAWTGNGQAQQKAADAAPAPTGNQRPAWLTK